MKNIKDCMKSRMKKRAEFVKAPYGYRIKDRQLVVEEMEAFRVRSALKFVMDYLNPPPEYMVLEFIDYKKDTQHLVLNYEEAANSIPYSWICRQVGKEIELREQYFQAGEDISLLALQNVMELSFTEVESHWSNQGNLMRSAGIWAKRLRKMPASVYYAGVVTARTKSYSEELRYIGNYEPIISKEQFDALNKRVNETVFVD